MESSVMSVETFKGEMSELYGRRQAKGGLHTEFGERLPEGPLSCRVAASV